jgi:hypothetical protein
MLVPTAPVVVLPEVAERPAVSCETDRAQLVAGIDHLDLPEQVPSRLIVEGERSCPVVLQDDHTIVATGRVGAGRVVVFGHEHLLTSPLMTNAAVWGEAIRLDPSASAAAVDGATVGGPGDLAGVDLFAITSYGALDADAIASVGRFVDRGGTLVVAGQAWWHGSAPGNALLEAAGMTITNVGGRMGTVPIGPVDDRSHHGKAAAYLPDPLAATTMAFAIAHLGPGAAIEEVSTQRGSIVPTSASPVTVDPLTRLAAQAQAEHYATDPLDGLTIYPGVADFPGEVDPNEPRVTERVTVSATYGGLDARYHYAAAGSPVWRSTGLYVPAGEIVTVTVPPALVGSGADLQVGVHTDTLWNLDEWTRFPDVIRRAAIDATRIEVGSAFGGPLVLRVPAGMALGEQTLVIEGAVRKGPWTEIEAQGLTITAPAERVTDREALTALWDDLMASTEQLNGTPRGRTERIVLDRQIGGGWMHSGYPVMAQLAGSAEIIDIEAMRGGRAWGPLHELGHNHQWASWTLPGTTEAGCNLWALYANETVLGLPPAAAHHELAHETRAARRAEYSGEFSDWSTWVALETYIDLKDRFGWEFYTEVFATYRAMEAQPSSVQERVDTWARVTSAQAGVDLGPFYTGWGLPVSADVLADLSQLPPARW